MSITSDSKLLFDSLESKFSEHLFPLNEISYNESDSREFIVMNFNSLHFDKIPAFMSDGYENRKSSSVDTLIYSHENDSLYLIEFKERWPKHSGAEIRLKGYDSISKLCLFWTNILKRNRQDFFKLKINYCLITRSSKPCNNANFLAALNNTREAFQLKMLENTLVEKTRVLVTPDAIYKFLSRITGVNEMIYVDSKGVPKTFGA